MKKRFLKLMLLAFLIVPLSVAFQSCSTDENGNQGIQIGSTFIPIVDMVNVDWDPSPMEITLWLDVLNPRNPAGDGPKDRLNADARIADADCDFGWMCHVQFFGGDLYAKTCSTPRVCIFRDYLTLTDSSTTDGILGTTTGMLNGRGRMGLGGGVLSVGNHTDDEVLIFDAPDTITGNDATAPDVVLVTDINQPTSQFHYNNMLFVSNGTAATDGDNVVSIWNDLSGLIAGGVDTAPDVELDEDTSFLDGPGLGSGGAKRAIVSNNRLFVATGVNWFGGIFIFNGADSLVDHALPDAVLGAVFNPTGFGVHFPNDDDDNVTGNIARLWVGHGNGSNCTGGDSVAATVWENADSLVDGQTPVGLLGDDFGIWNTHEIRSAGDALFVNGHINCNYDEGAINIWLNEADAVAGAQPDIHMQGSGGVYTPGRDPFGASLSIDAVLRDTTI